MHLLCFSISPSEMIHGHLLMKYTNSRNMRVIEKAPMFARNTRLPVT